MKRLPGIGDGPKTRGKRSHANTFRAWALDGVVGGAVGGLIGVIVAVNIVIYGGIEDGYEASIADVFRESPVVGLLASAAVIIGVVAGIMLARRIRTGHGPDL